MQRALLAAAFLPVFAAAALAQDIGSRQDTGSQTTPPADAVSDATVDPFDGPFVPIFPLRPDDQASVPGRGGVDPWGGLVITVTPAGGDAGDAAVLDPEQSAGITAEPDVAPLTDIEIDPFASVPDEVPSLWTSIEFALGDAYDAPAPAKPVSRVSTQTVRAVPQPLPTNFELNQGPARFSVLTSVSTSQPVSSALSTEIGGGSGEVKGRVGYVMDNLSVYGVGGLGASAGSGPVSIYDSALFGTSYTVPLAPFGLGANDRVGARIEVDRAQTTATAVELRRADGKLERYISVESSAPANAEPSGKVRAGVIGRF